MGCLKSQSGVKCHAFQHCWKGLCAACDDFDQNAKRSWPGLPILIPLNNPSPPPETIYHQAQH